ncbi:MAG: FecCD family ABC transporter permease [Thermodesulfobacteriota bacterium]
MEQIKMSEKVRIVTPGRVIAVTAAMIVLLGVVMSGAMVLGTADLSPGEILVRLMNPSGESDSAGLILFRIRLPRILLAAVVGFSLSLGGVVFQAILRNPLADPFILGVSSGAALGAVLGIILGLGFSLGIPVAAFTGTLLTLVLLLALGRRRMGTESATILLTGVIINAFFTALIMFFITTTTDSRLHSMLFWLYGDLGQTRYAHLAVCAPIVAVGGAVLFAFSRDLNLLTAGEETARQLGVRVERTKIVCLVTVSLLVGLVVSFSGLIGFVGLIVPHLARMTFGADHRVLIPTAAVGGAAFLVAADTLARTVISPGELPVGVITAFLGAPFFLYLLKTRGSRWTRS